MINNDSVVTAYDEHLTLVEWLQKVEVLLKNGGLKELSVNDKGNATFSLTLTFNDGSKIESNAMTLTSVNTALHNLSMDLNTATHRIDDLENEIDYHGVNMSQPFDKDNSVRIGTEFSTEEWTLKRSDTEVELSDEEASTAKQVLLKAINYGFIAYVDNSDSVYGVLAHAYEDGPSLQAIFITDLNAHNALGFLGVHLKQENGVWKYSCDSN